MAADRYRAIHRGCEVIVQDKSPMMVAAAVRAIAGRVRDEVTEERMAYYDAYEGRGMKDAVAKFFSAEQMASAPAMTQRIVRKIIDARYCAYKQPPTRTGDERYIDELIGPIDSQMSHLERMTGLQGTMSMLRFWDAGKGALDSRVLPVFEALFLPGEVEPFGVAYPLHDPDQTDAAKRSWAVWTDVDYFVVQGSRILPGMDSEGNERPETAHGLGMLPVLFAHVDSEPIAQRWFRAGAVDVVNAQLLFNVYGTHHALGIMWHALGQPVATGVDDPRAVLQLGVTRALVLPQGSTFRFETPNSDLSAIMEAQRWVVDSVAYANHLQVKWAAGGGATSGEHLRMMEVDLTEAVLADFNRWRAFEDDRFALDRLLLESVGITIAEEYSVDFTEPHIPDSPAEKRAQWDWELDRGLTDKRRVLSELNPDMSEEEIEERLAEVEASAPAPAEPAGVSAFAAALARPVNG